MNRKRHNRAAICSSDNYRGSRLLHSEYLKERHLHFNEMLVDGRITIDSPVFKDGKMTPRFRTIRIFGRDMTVTMEEYNIHCAHLKL